MFVHTHPLLWGIFLDSQHFCQVKKIKYSWLFDCEIFEKFYNYIGLFRIQMYHYDTKWYFILLFSCIPIHYNEEWILDHWCIAKSQKVTYLWLFNGESFDKLPPNIWFLHEKIVVWHQDYSAICYFCKLITIGNNL